MTTKTKPTYDELVEQTFQKLYADDLQSERFTKLTPDEQKKIVDRAMTDHKVAINALVFKIRDRDVQLYFGHTLDVHNKRYREIFEWETGIKLPPTSQASQAALREYLGEEKVAESQRQRTAAKLEKENAEAAKKEAAHAATMLRIMEKIERDVEVPGESLIDVARYLKVDEYYEIHPRTIGTIRKRVVTIKSGQSRVYGTVGGKKQAGVPSTVYALYNVVRSACYRSLVYELVKADGTVWARLLGHALAAEKSARDAHLADVGPTTIRVVFERQTVEALKRDNPSLESV
jgi:hypothetical protein